MVQRERATVFLCSGALEVNVRICRWWHLSSVRLRSTDRVAFDHGMGVCVMAVDIGSVRPPSNFAWAAFDAPGRDLVSSGTDPESAVSALVPGLRAGTQAALLLEAPMSVPVPDGQPDAWHGLGKARGGERNRPWSAGGGAGALATGLAQGAWMLRQLAVSVPMLAATTQAGRWRHGDAQLLLAEAFITASGKPEPLPEGQHAADARAAGLAFVEVLASPAPLVSTVCCSPQEPFNLLAAMALWAGLQIDPGELHAEVLVVAARPAPQARQS
jgi:hypothetical protein